MGIDTLCAAIGELPLLRDAEEEDVKVDETDGAAESKAEEPHYLTRTVVLPDGTYSQSTMAMTSKLEQELEAQGDPDGAGAEARNNQHLRRLLLSGEYFLAAVLSSSLLKLLLRYREFAGRHSHKLVAKA